MLIALGTFLAARAVSASGQPPALSASPAAAATTTLCQEQTAPVSGGTYIVQNNEFDSSASECVRTDASAGFTVANSSIGNATNGPPGAYPSIYQGCHWGNCSSGGLSAHPIQVASLTPGTVTTSWSTAQPGGGSAYDVAYDIWFNQTPVTTGQPNGSELMVWLNHNGSVQPFGSEVASNVTLGGHTYNIWEGTQSSWDTITYDMTSPATSVAGLDVGTLTQDMVSRGYTKSSWYLIDVEAGFELWQGGAGLRTNSFSVTDNGSTPGPTPTSAIPSPSPTSPRGRRLLRRVLGGKQLAGRLPGAGRGHEHRIGRAEQLAARLDLPWQPDGQQPLERQLHPVRRQRDRDEPVLQRHARTRRQHDDRLHRDLLRQQHRTAGRVLQVAVKALRRLRWCPISATVPGCAIATR